MVPVFWTGLGLWLLFALAPLRAALGLMRHTRNTSTGGLSYQETLAGGKRGGLDDAYMPKASAHARLPYPLLLACLPAALLPVPQWLHGTAGWGWLGIGWGGVGRIDKAISLSRKGGAQEAFMQASPPVHHLKIVNVAW